MKLKQLSLHNFICYKNETINFPDDKIIFISGIDVDRNTSNGVGKSAIKEAILFALFGKNRLNLSDLVYKGEESCEVLLQFILKNDAITIKRQYNSLSKSSSVDIWINQEKQNLQTITQKNKFIINLIQFDYDSFVNFSIFDVVRFDDLSEISNSELKRLFRMLFNYEKFEKSILSLKDKYRRLNQVLSDFKNPTIHYYSDKRLKILDEGIKDMYSHISDTQSKIKEIENSQVKLIKQKSYFETLINKNVKLINQVAQQNSCPVCGSSLTNKTKILNTYQNEIDNYSKQAVEIQEKIAKFEEDLKTLKNLLTSLQINRLPRLLKFKNDLNLLKRHTTNIDELKKKYMLYKNAAELMDKFSLFVLQHHATLIESILNDFLSKLTDITCHVKFVYGTNKCYIELLRDNKVFSYDQLSSGEKMLITYAFKFTINMVNYKHSILFIDEGLGRLDQINRNKLIELLKLAPFNQIFIISHDPINTSQMAQIFITKKDNNSSIKIIN